MMVWEGVSLLGASFTHFMLIHRFSSAGLLVLVGGRVDGFIMCNV